MSQLKDIQTLFGQFIKDPQPSDFLSLVKKGASAPEARLKIYLNSVYESLIAILSITYPRTFKLLGKEKSHQIALAFIKKDFPHTGYMEDWGANFFKHLKSCSKIIPFAWELAQFEWQEQIAFWTQDCPPLDSKKALHDCTLDEVEEFVFTPHPTLYLTAFSYDLVTVVKQLDEAIIPKNVLQKKTYCIQVRPEFVVRFYWITEDIYEFLSYLSQGQTLGKAYETMIHHHSQFDVEKTLTFAFSAGLFVHFMPKKEKLLHAKTHDAF